jgi:hypothetical protein
MRKREPVDETERLRPKMQGDFLDLNDLNI